MCEQSESKQPNTKTAVLGERILYLNESNIQKERRIRYYPQFKESWDRCNILYRDFKFNYARNKSTQEIHWRKGTDNKDIRNWTMLRSCKLRFIILLSRPLEKQTWIKVVIILTNESFNEHWTSWTGICSEIWKVKYPLSKYCTTRT